MASFNSLYWVQLKKLVDEEIRRGELSIPSIGFQTLTDYQIKLNVVNFQFPLLGSEGEMKQ